MDRRNFLVTGSAAAFVAATTPVRIWAQAAATAPAGPGDAALNATFDKIFQQVLVRNPTLATMFGLDTGANAGLKRRLPETTPAARIEGLAELEAAQAAIAVDETRLSPQMRLHRDVIAYTLEDYAVGPERFELNSAGRPFVVTQQHGAYFDIPDFLNTQHTIRTVADADAYLARLDAFGAALDGDTETLRIDASRGVVAPDFSLDLALGQLDALRKPAAAASGLVTSLSRRATAAKLAGDWNARAAKIVEGRVYPALDRQIALVRQLRAKGRASAGVWDIPRGDEIYAAALASSTTSTLSPDEVHQMGLTQVAEISAQLDTILKAQGLTRGSVGARLTALNADPSQLYPDTTAGRAQLIADLNLGMEDMTTRLPKAFATLPGVPIEIRAVPTDIQDGASNGYYIPAPFDNSRPAIYFINLKSVGDWPKYTLPALTYHEADPGHHLQNSVANLGDVPMLRKIAWFSAYGEGWALYAESVADELGAYKTPVGRAGFLQSYLFRAARLVVDTGLHTKRWDRAKATAYMVETTGFAQPRSQREVERYCVQPGQACSYKIGHNSWVKMRARAEEIMGDRFDLKQFHEVLRDGALPLTVFERRVEERARAAIA